MKLMTMGDTLSAMYKFFNALPISTKTLHLVLFENTENESAVQYADMIQKDCSNSGIKLSRINMSQLNLFTMLDEIYKVERDSSVTAITIQEPLPAHLIDRRDVILTKLQDTQKWISRSYGYIDYTKIDTLPATVRAISNTLFRYDIKLMDKNVLVIGRSEALGRPLIEYLLRNNASVMVAHTYTSVETLIDMVNIADIIISIAGQAHLLNSSFTFHPHQIIIDCGCSFVDGKLCGDVDPAAIEDIVYAATPVPGGIGPATRRALLNEVLGISGNYA